MRFDKFWRNWLLILTFIFILFAVVNEGGRGDNYNKIKELKKEIQEIREDVFFYEIKGEPDILHKEILEGNGGHLKKNGEWRR